MKIFRYKVTVGDEVRIMSIGVDRYKSFIEEIDHDKIDLSKSTNKALTRSYSGTGGYSLTCKIDDKEIAKHTRKKIRTIYYYFSHTITAPMDVDKFSMVEEKGRLQARMKEVTHAFSIIPNTTVLDNYNIIRAYAGAYARQVANTELAKLKDVKGKGIHIEFLDTDTFFDEYFNKEK